MRYCETCGSQLVNGEIVSYSPIDGQPEYEKLCPKKEKLSWWKKMSHYVGWGY